MRKYVQPFREDIPAGHCVLCRETVFAGDLAYRINGETYCYGCVRSSSFIAEDDGDDEGEQMLCTSSVKRKEVLKWH